MPGSGPPPFRDNVDHAYRHGVRYIAEPGGSIRSAEVHDAYRGARSRSPAPAFGCPPWTMRGLKDL